MTETFITALREAHAVTTSHQMGDKTCADICRRTRLPFPVVREWSHLLQIPLDLQGQAAVHREFQPGYGFIQSSTEKE